MKRITFLTGAGGLLAALLATPLAAQHTTHVGILGGVDFATFAGSDASGGSFFDPGSGLTMSATKGSSTNFLGGIFVQIPAGKSLWFEPQLLYEGKGANYAATISDGSTTVSGDMTFNVDYLTIPVLLRYDFEEGGGPYGLVGPEVSFNLGCSVDFSGGLSAAGSWTARATSGSRPPPPSAPWWGWAISARRSGWRHGTISTSAAPSRIRTSRTRPGRSSSATASGSRRTGKSGRPLRISFPAPVAGHSPPGPGRDHPFPIAEWRRKIQALRPVPGPFTCPSPTSRITCRPGFVGAPPWPGWPC